MLLSVTFTTLLSKARLQILWYWQKEIGLQKVRGSVLGLRPLQFAGVKNGCVNLCFEKRRDWFDQGQRPTAVPLGARLKTGPEWSPDSLPCEAERREEIRSPALWNINAAADSGDPDHYRCRLLTFKGESDSIWEWGVLKKEKKKSQGRFMECLVCGVHVCVCVWLSGLLSKRILPLSSKMPVIKCF